MKELLKNNPFVSKIISFFYTLLNFNSYKIKGKNNKIIRNNTYLKKCNFIIRGGIILYFLLI